MSGEDEPMDSSFVNLHTDPPTYGDVIRKQYEVSCAIVENCSDRAERRRLLVTLAAGYLPTPDDMTDGLGPTVAVNYAIKALAAIDAALESEGLDG